MKIINTNYQEFHLMKITNVYGPGFRNNSLGVPNGYMGFSVMCLNLININAEFTGFSG